MQVFAYIVRDWEPNSDDLRKVALPIGPGEAFNATFTELCAIAESHLPAGWHPVAFSTAKDPTGIPTYNPDTDKP
jgi:hypothetical protein